MIGFSRWTGALDQFIEIIERVVSCNCYFANTFFILPEGVKNSGKKIDSQPIIHQRGHKMFGLGNIYFLNYSPNFTSQQELIELRDSGGG